MISTRPWEGQSLTWPQAVFLHTRPRGSMESEENVGLRSRVV